MTDYIKEQKAKIKNQNDKSKLKNGNIFHWRRSLFLHFAVYL